MTAAEKAMQDIMKLIDEDVSSFSTLMAICRVAGRYEYEISGQAKA